MKTLRLVFLLAISCICFAPAALAAKAKNPAQERLLGMWQASAPAAGVIQFDPNQTMRFYLTKEEATRKGMRWIEARWSLGSGNVIRLNYLMNRKSHKRTMRFIFKSNDELWLTERGKGTIKYLRVKGELPAPYNWQ